MCEKQFFSQKQCVQEYFQNMVLSIKAIMQLYLGSARKQRRSTLKGSKQKHEVLRISSAPSVFCRDMKRHVLCYFRATSGHNMLCMRRDISKEMSRFRLPSSGQRRLCARDQGNYNESATRPITKASSSSHFHTPLIFCSLLSQPCSIRDFFPF